MPLRRRPKQKPAPPPAERAICVRRLVAYGFPPLDRCQQVAIDDPRVAAFPSHFLGVVPLPFEEVET